jgi:pentatricopeptide repeat protein
MALATRRGSNRHKWALPKLSWTLKRRTVSRNAVLWVDDHPENNTVLGRLLEETGCEVVAVRTTEVALQMLSTGRYRVVISDMGRAGSPKAGLDLLERMRSRGLKTPSVIYTSVNAAAIYGAEARQLGAVECTAGAITLVATLSAIFSQ